MMLVVGCVQCGRRYDRSVFFRCPSCRDTRSVSLATTASAVELLQAAAQIARPGLIEHNVGGAVSAQPSEQLVERFELAARVLVYALRASDRGRQFLAHVQQSLEHETPLVALEQHASEPDTRKT